MSNWKFPQPGKQSVALLCFRRTAVLRFEIFTGASLAILPYQDRPHHIVKKGALVTGAQLAELRRKYVVGCNGMMLSTSAFGRDAFEVFGLPVAPANHEPSAAQVRS